MLRLREREPLRRRLLRLLSRLRLRLRLRPRSLLVSVAVFSEVCGECASTSESSLVSSTASAPDTTLPRFALTSALTGSGAASLPSEAAAQSRTHWVQLSDDSLPLELCATITTSPAHSGVPPEELDDDAAATAAAAWEDGVLKTVLPGSPSLLVLSGFSSTADPAAELLPNRSRH